MADISTWQQDFSHGDGMGQAYPDMLPPGAVVSLTNMRVDRGALAHWIRRYRVHPDTGKTPSKAVVWGTTILCANSDGSMSKVEEVAWESLTMESGRWVATLTSHLSDQGLGRSCIEFDGYLYTNEPKAALTNKLTRFDSTSYQPEACGLAAPTGTHTVTEAGGSLPQGTYSTFWTFYDASFESNAGPIVDTATSAASKQLGHTNVPVGPAGTVGRKLYRAYTSSVAAGVRGVVFRLVGTIADNTTTTYTDNVDIGALGDTHLQDHGIAPAMSLLCEHRGRLFGFSGDTLFWSKADEPYYWPTENYARIGDTTAIIDIVSYRGNLIIFKASGIWVLTGTYCFIDENMEAQTDFDIMQIDHGNGALYNGLDADHKVSANDSGFVWIGHDGLYHSDGSQSKRILRYEGSGLLADAFYSTWFHAGSFYFYYRGSLVVGDGTDKLLKWDPLADRWERDTQIGIILIDTVQVYHGGAKRSFIVAITNSWDSTTGGNTLTIFDNVLPFASDSGEAAPGTNDHYGSAEVCFAPLVAPAPGQYLRPLDISIDGNWAGVTTARPVVSIITDDGTVMEVAAADWSAALTAGTHARVCPGAGDANPFLWYYVKLRQDGDVHALRINRLGLDANVGSPRGSGGR